jgi:hypothetical protein
MRIRFALVLTSLIAGLFTRPAHAVPFVIDTLARTVETSTLKLTFDVAGGCPERLVSCIYKPWSASGAVNSESLPWEFSGQVIQGLWAAQGPIFSQSTDAGARWHVLYQDASRLVIRIESHATWTGQPNPPVRTDYTFFPDSAGYLVDRTILFSQQPWSGTSLQPYVLRLSTGAGGVLVWRGVANNVLTSFGGAFCGGGCTNADWNGRWCMVQGSTFASTLHYPPGQPGMGLLMADNDSFSNSNWTGMLTSSGTFSTDLAWRVFVHFSTTPTNVALEDEIQSWVEGLPISGTPGPAAPALLALSVSPNPVRSNATVRCDLPRAGDVDLGVFDLAGRRVATLAAGARPAGAFSVRWDGRDAAGSPAPAGVYWIRLAAPGGTARTRVVRMP